MKLNEIMDYSSPEMSELFYMIEQTNSNINNYLGLYKPTFLSDQFLDNGEVCEMLHISIRTLQDYRDKGIISYYKLEGKILYKLSDIKKMLDNNYFDAWKLKK